MVCEKGDLCALVLLFHILSLISLAQCNGSYSTGFSFPSFGNDNRNQLIYMGNASYNSSAAYIDLTPSPNGRSMDQYSQLENCIGRVLYRQPITIWPATFTTTFTMLVRRINSPATQENLNGDGLAFIIVPSDKTFLPDSMGILLGLFSQSAYENTTSQLAIEFDTFKNIFDPDDNHVGIDVKSITSDVTASLGEHSINIKSGRPIRVRIHYDGWNKALQIYAAYADRPITYASILNRTIDLSRTVPRSAYVGFSAATGGSYEIQRILDWNFSSTTLPETSLNIVPVSAPRLAEGSIVPVSAPRLAEGSTSRRLKLGLFLGSIATVSVLLAFLVWFVRRTMRGRKGSGQSSHWRSSVDLTIMDSELANSPYGPHRFSYKRLSVATKNFSASELLGTGGFGSVYRGTLAGRRGAAANVAVKRVSAGSRQGKREFMSEINTIGRLRHRNLVRLQGWCHERDELLLVYDYMPNGSLERFIFRQPEEQHQNKNHHPLNWARRHRILCGLASALLYLHEEWEQKVVHRDVKPSNVMLDEDFNARLGDFGLARLIEHDEISPSVTTKLAGTPGYWAPECGYTGKATAESDVFSFGVVVLEVATGRRVLERKPPLAEESLMDFIWNLYGQGRVTEASDPRLNGCFEEEQMKRALILGLACSHPDPRLRPSIRQALQVLMNPNEEMTELPSSRPLAIYVVSPTRAGLNSRPASPYSNIDRARSPSSSACSEVPPITTSALHCGR